MPKRSSQKKRPVDPNQLAKKIVDKATGEGERKSEDTATGQSSTSTKGSNKGKSSCTGAT